MQWAIDSLKSGNLPQSKTSPVKKPTGVKQTSLTPKKKIYEVTFDNGTTVEFDREPTMQDVEEAYAQVKDYKKPEPEKAKWNMLMELTQWAITGGMRGIGNIASFIENTPSIGEMIFWKTDAQKKVEELKKQGKAPDIGWTIQKWAGSLASVLEDINRNSLNKDSISSKVWEFTGQVGLTNALLPWIWWATSLPAKIAVWATEWALQTGAYDAVSKWELSKKDILTWTILGAGMPIVWATFNKVKDFITKSLPKWLISSGLATPTALLNASERLSKLADDGILDVDSAPQWMLDKWLQGNKKQIAKQLTDVVEESAKKKSTLLASGTSIEAPQVSNLQQALGEILPNFAKVTKKWAITPTAGNAEKVEQIIAFINNKNPTAEQFDAARSLLWDMGIFTKSGALADSAQKEGLQRIWIEASKYLDEAFPWFRSINKDIEVAMALRKAIGLKEAQDLARKYWNLVNLGAASGGAYAGYQAGGAKWAVLGALWGLTWKYVINNPAVLTRLAQSLSKSWPGLDVLSGLWTEASKIVIPATTNALNTKE